MKLVLRLDGSVRIGMGHLVRCLALVDTLKQVAEMSCTLVTRSADLACPWPVIQIPASVSDGAEGAWIAATLPATEGLIADLYHPTAAQLRSLRAEKWKLVCIDDESPLEFDCDLLINPNLDTAFRHRYTAETRYLYGPEAILLREQFDCPIRRTCAPEPARLLIAFGGSDPAGLTMRVSEMLRRSWPRGLRQICVVLGNAFADPSAVYHLAVHDSRWQVLRDVQDMRALLEWADLAVIGAGTLLYEAAVTGLPALAISINESQGREASYLARMGAVRHPGDASEVTEADLMAAIEGLRPQMARQQMADSAQSTLRGGGRQFIADAIRHAMQDTTPRRPEASTFFASNHVSSAAPGAQRKSRGDSMIALTGPLIGDEEEQALIRCVRDHGVAQGDVASAFERRVAAYFDARGAVATNSGTSALILALRALDVGVGDEVVLPSYTCIAVLHAVTQVGATPVLADNECDPVRMNYNIGPDQIRRVVTSATRAVIVPHMFGVPAPSDEIIALGIPVIEDITLSLGACHKERPVGSAGAVAICSFHRSKMIACGEGGMLIARTDAVYRRARHLNSWEGEQAAQRFVGTRPPPYELRYNFHLSDLAASLGLVQFGRLAEFVARRRHLAERYDEGLKAIEGISIPQVRDTPNVFFRYIVSLHRREVIPVLRQYREAGIEAGRGVYPALHQVLGCDPALFPGAEAAVAANLSVPLYPALTDSEATTIVDQTRRILTGL